MFRRFLPLLTLLACAAITFAGPAVSGAVAQAQSIPAPLDELADWQTPPENVVRLYTAEGDSATVYYGDWWHARVDGSVHIDGTTCEPFTLSQMASNAEEVLLDAVGNRDESAVHNTLYLQFMCLDAFPSLRDNAGLEE